MQASRVPSCRDQALIPATQHVNSHQCVLFRTMSINIGSSFSLYFSVLIEVHSSEIHEPLTQNNCRDINIRHQEHTHVSMVHKNLSECTVNYNLNMWLALQEPWGKL